ncbi:TetR family transcriptional regulator [Saccharopolyspora shandongensis]|uniref:Transcriptional regulator, TetR family n=1 Tax=Saccharopolyspora shandongensis TaxID=418495 RepID=A0A1H2XM81_9PSEU|nr:TetR family transcriptional regulator [Saccharopolyspora shandongensis]SDW94001.1 transcriptional regulator, TetR family [Saccharopolyspora shandongensis]
MSEAATPAPRTRSGRTPHGRRRVRSSLALAAMGLFGEQGFEATTVDQIAEAAGVGRRTFFRYFRSKEDVVFPGHDERLAEVVELLAAADPAADPLAVLGRTAEVVLEMYLAEPEVSLKRFELTREVSALRDKEIASIDRYQRVFARYLRGRYAGEPGGDLRAAVVASAVVAAHNHVLRQWLKSGGELEAKALLREALQQVTVAMSGQWGRDDSAVDAGESVVVGVVRTAAPAGVVLKHLEEALRDIR